MAGIIDGVVDSVINQDSDWMCNMLNELLTDGINEYEAKRQGYY